MGQTILNLEPESDGSTRLTSRFQIALVTRPLMSAGKICDSAMNVELTDTKAIVKAWRTAMSASLSEAGWSLHLQDESEAASPRQG